MSTLAMAKKVASKFKATLVDDKCGHTHECRIEAPAGHIWSSDFIHEMIDSSY